MLNAFRHQRSFQSHYNDTGMALHGCAQRLSASEVFSGAFSGGMVTWWYLCSTPFGIRGLFSGRVAGGHRQHQQVLNAFRHQRSFQSSSAALTARKSGAQRLSASEVFSVAAVDFRVAPHAVLNAFRHQRSFQAV